MYKDFDKDLYNILTQHGWDAMMKAIDDEMERATKYSYDLGRDEGWCDCYDTYKEEIDGFDYAWEDYK